MLVVVLAAAVIDYRTRRIPNALTLPAILGGLLSWVAVGEVRAFFAVFGLVVLLLAIGFGLYAVGILGGGDAKLLAAVAALLGTGLTFEALLWTALFGGAVALGVLAWHKALFPLLTRMLRAGWDFAIWRLPPGDLVEGDGHRIPYAVVICGGVVLTLIADRTGFSLMAGIA